MNVMGLYIVCGLLVVMILYIVGGIIWDHRADIKDILKVRKHYHRKDALLIDYYRMDGALALYPGRNWMADSVRWHPKGQDPYEPYTDIYSMGYDKAEKWMSQLRYLGIPVFVRLHNFHLIDPATMDESMGKRNKATSSIMHNVWKNRTAKKYISGLTAKLKYAEMDVKTIGLMIPIIIGLVIGIAYFMVGF